VEPGVNGDLVPLGDVDATTAALDRLLADREKALAMGVEAARRLPETLHWNDFVAETMAVYESVVGGRR
jgi:glycosyltransferase involved in cell wall biosynthesis